MPRDDLIQFRRGTTAEWSTYDPVLGDGEPGCALDTGLVKIGNGVLPWSALPGIAGLPDSSGAAPGDVLALDGGLVPEWVPAPSGGGGGASRLVIPAGALQRRGDVSQPRLWWPNMGMNRLAAYLNFPDGSAPNTVERIAGIGALDVPWAQVRVSVICGSTSTLGGGVRWSVALGAGGPGTLGSPVVEATVVLDPVTNTQFATENAVTAVLGTVARSGVAPWQGVMVMRDTDHVDDTHAGVVGLAGIILEDAS